MTPFDVDGDWQGTTSLGGKIAFRVVASQVSIVWFDWTATDAGSACTDGGRYRDYGASDVVDNAFKRSTANSTLVSVLQTGGGSLDTYELSGSFSSATGANGTLSVTESTAGSGNCDATASPTWTATKLAPISYDGAWSGTSSQGKAVSFTVAGNQVIAASFGYDLYVLGTSTPLACHPSDTASWNGTPATPDIVSGWAEISGSGGAILAAWLNLSFDTSTSAYGSGYLRYLTGSGISACSGNTGNTPPTWTATRQ